MLVRFGQSKDRWVWVNALNVTYLQQSPSRSDQTQIYFSHEHFVTVAGTPQAAADALGAAARRWSSAARPPRASAESPLGGAEHPPGPRRMD